MALETASYITQLNVANPSSTDTVSQADDHLRLIKSVLKNTFPNLDQPVTATPAQINVPIPSGFIGLWSGSVANIPAGWVLCNGSNGTPDLRNRFVVGAGDTYAVNGIGGSTTQTLSISNIPTHTHTVSGSGTTGSAGSHNHTINDPGHAHNYTSFVAGGGWAAGGGAYNVPSTFTSSGSGTGITINSGGEHTHAFSFSATTSSTGSGAAFSILPPYYALAYIMKT